MSLLVIAAIGCKIEMTCCVWR